MFQYTEGITGTDAGGYDASTANWFGSASGATQWNTAPGTWGGLLDAIYNNKLTNTACPSAYAKCVN